MLAFSRQVRGPADEVASHCHARHKAGRNPLGTGPSTGVLKDGRLHFGRQNKKLRKSQNTFR